jgi:hypothetical protein
MIQQYSKAENAAFARGAATETAKSGRKPDWIVTYERYQSIINNRKDCDLLQVKMASRYLALNRANADEYYKGLADLEKKPTISKAPLAEKPFA